MSADILHVDLDAFYVSVERRADPKLDGVPVVVGGGGARGVVLSCSYEARALGVRNGMPSARARRLCPATVFVPPNFDAYASASRAFRELLESFTPRVEPISLDEAFCDVSGAHRLYGTSDQIAEAIRARVSSELGLVCSVGGGPTKLVAKIASRTCKPDGALVVRDPVAFLHPRPIEDLWGVGEVTAGALRGLGISTIADLARTPTVVLWDVVGEAAAAHLAAVAWGRDPSPVEARTDARSVGAEQTFERDIEDPDVIRAELLQLADRVASRLSAAGLRARTITVKIRLADFQTHTRSETLRVPTGDVWTIYRTASDAYARFRRGRRSLRLLGVTATGLVAGDAAEQLTLDPGPSYAEAEAAVERVRSRFGSTAVRLARLIGNRRTDD